MTPKKQLRIDISALTVTSYMAGLMVSPWQTLALCVVCGILISKIFHLLRKLNDPESPKPRKQLSTAQLSVHKTLDRCLYDTPEYWRGIELLAQVSPDEDEDDTSAVQVSRLSGSRPIPLPRPKPSVSADVETSEPECDRSTERPPRGATPEETIRDAARTKTSHSKTSYAGGVFDHLQLDSIHTYLNCIVLETLTIRAQHVDGVVYFPEGCEIQTDIYAFNTNLRCEVLSWRRLEAWVYQPNTFTLADVVRLKRRTGDFTSDAIGVVQQCNGNTYTVKFQEYGVESQILEVQGHQLEPKGRMYRRHEHQ